MKEAKLNSITCPRPGIAEVVGCGTPCQTVVGILYLEGPSVTPPVITQTGIDGTYKLCFQMARRPRPRCDAMEHGRAEYGRVHIGMDTMPIL